MKRTFRTVTAITLAAVLLGGALAARAADYFSPVPGECKTDGVSENCSINQQLSLDPGYNNVALYVQQPPGSGVWQMVACYPRHPTLRTGVGVWITWIARQYHFKFKLNSQNDCNPAVITGGDEHVSTGNDPPIVSGPASGNPHAGWVYRAVPNGLGGYTYHWLTDFYSCGQVFNRTTLKTCWTGDPNLARPLTKKAAEMTAGVFQRAMTDRNAGLNPSYGYTGSNGQFWVWAYSMNYFGGPYYYHWLVDSYLAGAYPNDPSAGHWLPTLMGGDASQYFPMDSGSAVVLYRVGDDGAKSAGIYGMAYGYVEQ